MQSSSYGVDSSKGAANVSNPYDFKNVQVRKLIIIHSRNLLSYFLYFLIMIEILNINFKNSKNLHLHPIKTDRE